MKNKFSRYNYLFRKEKQGILYNISSDGIMVLSPELVDLVIKYREDIDALESVHKALFDEMLRQGMIVAVDYDEVKTIVDKWKEEDNDPGQFTLIVLPTLDCNLRCWYCFEEHKKGSKMSQDTFERFCRLVDHITESGELKVFNLDFFGGEPLLPFKVTTLPLIKYVSKRCLERGIDMTLRFTTNGVLLTDGVREELLKIPLKFKPNFQITIDGDREHHDKTKFMANGKPTYDLIIRNIKAALKDGMPVTNRFNYTAETIDGFESVIREYDDLSEDERKLLQFDFQQVWQEGDNKKCWEKAQKISNSNRDKNHEVRMEKHFNKYRCIHESNRHVAVTYNGNVYLCTTRDMTDDNRMGYVKEDGTIAYNDLYMMRESVKYGNETCQSCKVFPVCHGACSQTKLEARNNGCVLNYTEEDRMRIVEGRLSHILKYNSEKS